MIGSFGRIVFKVSDKQVTTLNNQINREYKSKISEHTAIYGPGMIRHQGRELSEVSLSITLISSLITETSLEEQLNDIKTMWEFGEYAYLTLGGQTFGAFPFLITGMSEKNSYFNVKKGSFDVVELDLTLKEYIDNPQKYNQIIESLKAQEKEQEQTTEEIENVQEEQKTKLDQLKNNINKATEKINKTLEKIENKKNEILDKLEQIKKDYKVHEFMNLIRAGLITADKIKEMTEYSKTMKSETDRQILMNVIRNYLGGM
jgi:hypothetical protein|nr:MAG TPA: hypothetical protein [Caudoviricetes sp.]DAQ81965.1 MAG TPA: hypothetical protein [Caudoviricetes sp.]DAY25843.1 MAG TPA: hypothetical protein [Caudoviricetes sp.]